MARALQAGWPAFDGWLDKTSYPRAHSVALRSHSGLATARASQAGWRAFDGWLALASSPTRAQRDAAIRTAIRAAAVVATTVLATTVLATTVLATTVLCLRRAYTII